MTTKKQVGYTSFDEHEHHTWNYYFLKMQETINKIYLNPIVVFIHIQKLKWYDYIFIFIH